ncbi:hypothetical protein D3C84_822810 [compost metagenome]
MDALAGHLQFDTLVDQAFGIHAFVDAGFAQQVNGALLEDTGTNAAEDVVRRLAFDDDVVDAGAMQQLTEQEAGRAGADDGDLGFHGGNPVLCDSRRDASQSVCFCYLYF